MIELLCISTHPKKAVMFGHTYPLLKDGDNDQHACKCNKGMFDVGVRHPEEGIFKVETKAGFTYIPEPSIGAVVKCSACQQVFIYGGRIWWISKQRFGLVSEETEESTYEKRRELQLAGGVPQNPEHYEI